MKKHKKKIIILLIILTISIVSFGLINNISINSSKDKNIDKILESKEYSYLPKEAKNYIKKVYEKTGEVILTEKNKEKNTPYLNPRFVSYLTLSDEQKKETELVPDSIIMARSNFGSTTEEQLPSKFDLRNVNGKNYVTPVENQGKLGVCWSFASLSQAESYLLVTKDQTFDQNTSKVFSKRQLDYASAKNGVKGHLLSTTRLLGDGGNYNTFLYPSISHVSKIE